MVILAIKQGDMLRKLAVLVCAGFILLAGCSETGNVTIIPVAEPAVLQPMVSSFDDFWAAMRHFDFDFVNRREAGAEDREFARGLRLLMDDDCATAEPLFRTLLETTADPLVRRHAAEILWVLYTRQDKWNELVALNGRAPRGFDERKTVVMSAAFAGSRPEKYHFPDKPVILPSELSASGTPMVAVAVNGVRKMFLIDTGAEMTVLSSDFAEECGVKAIGTEAAKVGTATDITIDMRPAVIREFHVGDLRIENHPVMILDKKDLEVKLFKVIRIFTIDGIIGWNVIRNLDLTLDYKNLTVTIRQPRKRPADRRNLHFVIQPIVSLSDTLGRPFYFFLDTGADRTSLYEPALLKVDTTQAKSGRALIGGAGGTQRYKTTEIPKFAVMLGNQRLVFNKIRARDDGENGFFFFDGVLGSDIARNGSLIIDFQNGRCDLIIPE